MAVAPKAWFDLPPDVTYDDIDLAYSDDGEPVFSRVAMRHIEERNGFDTGHISESHQLSYICIEQLYMRHIDSGGDECPNAERLIAELDGWRCPVFASHDD